MTSETAAEQAQLARVTAELDAYKKTLRGLRMRMTNCSFYKELESYKNLIDVVGANPTLDQHPLRGITHKLLMYAFAQSHGVRPPTVHRIWEDPKSMDLQQSELPERFVLKSNGGSSSRGVLPLQTLPGDRYRIIGGTRELTAEQVTGFFQEGRQTGEIYGPLFAEDLIVQSSSEMLPDDVKIYAAYGQILQVMLRRVGTHGDPGGLAFRFVDAEGADLGPVFMGHAEDRSIEIPADVGELVTAARHLSRATGLPFARVDLYSSVDGVVFGEITRAPGGEQMFTMDHDRLLGTQWKQAEGQLQQDFATGRPAGRIWGDSPIDPVLSAQLAADEDVLWPPRSRPCAQWCSDPGRSQAA